MTEPTAGEVCADAAKQDICIPYFEMLASRVEKVLALHHPMDAEDTEAGFCFGCIERVKWPCPTVRILNGEEP